MRNIQEMIGPINEAVLELPEGISTRVMRMSKLEWMLELPD